MVIVGALLLSSCGGGSTGTSSSSFDPALSGASPMDIEPEFFGMHDGRLGYGATPDESVGSVRLWDSGTTWRQVELSEGNFSWTTLDAAVASAEEAGARPVVVFGQTPNFHAEDPAAEGFHGVGTSSMPDRDAWRRYVTETAERYGDRVDYQVWNEPNVPGFWTGSTEQMARLTADVHDVVTEVVGEQGTVVSPSFPLRLEAQRTWFEDYWASSVDGRNVAEYVDVVALNLYPLPDETPEDTLELLEDARQHLSEEASGLPVWDTEINYGLPRSGDVEPIPDDLQRAYVMRTYLLSADQDLSRVYWYRWDIGEIANTHLTEDDHQTLTLAGEGYRTIHEWLAGTEFLGCEATSGEGAYRCVARDDEGHRIFHWSPGGDEVTVRTPEATVARVDADGTVTEREGSYELTVGATPVMLRVAG